MSAETAPRQAADLRECGQCGMICTLPRMRPELVADCPRCGHSLWRMRKRPFEFPIACGLAAALFYIYAIVAPFLEITAYGRFSQARMETGPVQLSLQGYEWVAALVLGVSIILPGVKLGLMLATLIGLRSRLVPPLVLKIMFRWYGPIGPWAMVDVYLLGFLVAYTRLTAIADVHLDTAVYSLVGLMISMAAADAALDGEAVWRALDAAEQERGPHSAPPAPPAGGPAALQIGGSAARHIGGSAARHIGCHGCSLVNLGVPGERCARCRTTLRPRKTDSIARGWAFLIAAAALYIPANLYPVFEYTQLGQTTPFTIMSGIIELLGYGLWPLALLVFLASITIPLMKLLTLGYMLINTQRGSDEHLQGRTVAFRIIDFIGRWSMIDVFMISILVALVRFNQFASIQADTGAPCFAAVVVLTMFAVEAFDPRLMWDVCGEQGQGGFAPLDPPLRAQPLEPFRVGTGRWEGTGIPAGRKAPWRRDAGPFPASRPDPDPVPRAVPLAGVPRRRRAAHDGAEPPGLAFPGTPA